MPKRRKSSAAWLREHFSDPYVQRAQAEGWRSRAVFKLQEIDERDHLLRLGQQVVDLGAAPGGWSQYAARKVGGEGRVVAFDLLPIPPLPGVICLQGDFRESQALEAVAAALAGRSVDVVLSDMAPNTSGVEAVDQIRSLALAEAAEAFALDALRPGGIFWSNCSRDRVLTILCAACEDVSARSWCVSPRPPASAVPRFICWPGTMLYSNV